MPHDALDTQGDGRGAAAAAALETRGLTAGYAHVPVVEGADLQVAPGEVLCLVGPNGSGKSTLIKTVTAQIAPLSGTVLLDGRDAHRMRASQVARNLSVMLTGRVAAEMLSCLDVVETGRLPFTAGLGTLRQDDRDAVRDAMELVGAWELRERDFMQISDGQRQRVLLARAIAQRPRVMVLDEPTSYLDIRHQLELLGCVRGLARKRRVACVLSLHELGLAQKVADRLACVCEGRVAAQGTPEEVLDAATVARVFDLGQARYDEAFATVEDAPMALEPRVFVLGGAGTAAGAMRALRREGVGFCLGVVPENDLDCALARRLTAHTVSVGAFRQVDEAAVGRACEALVGCEALLDCLAGSAGPLEPCRQALLGAARAAGIPVFRDARRYLETFRNQPMGPAGPDGEEGGV